MDGPEWGYEIDPGQSFEIEVPLQLDWIAAGDLPRIAAAFHAEHERLYGHSSANAAISLVSLRMVVVGASPQPQFPLQPLRTDAPRPAKQVEVFCKGTSPDTSAVKMPGK